MKVKEITPKRYRCTAAACPSIFEVEGSDELIIIGPKADLKELGLEKRVGKNEEAVIVPKGMIKEIFKK
jgi:hypothetical protein